MHDEISSDIAEWKTDVATLKTDVGNLLHHFGLTSGWPPGELRIQTETLPGTPPFCGATAAQQVTRSFTRCTFADA